MVLPAAAVERAMKIQEVIMRALSGTITWLQAAEILGLDPRSCGAGAPATRRAAGSRCMTGGDSARRGARTPRPRSSAS
jgi:hypothetical protein